MQPVVIHLIPNAHLDPVWMWDWREGFTEMVKTTRTVLDLMDEFPDLTFTRGEAFLYRTVEEIDPVAFKRIQVFVEAGRWDVVGGTMLQSDMNLPATETILRHILYAQRYFAQRFGRAVRTGWSADCFGHSGALPDLLAAGGMINYAYTRPDHVPPQTTFWWSGPAGARLLVYHPVVGWYGSERVEMPDRLDKILEKGRQGVTRSLGCFMGLGDHGGHPSRRQIADAIAWGQAHPEVSLRFSTLTGYFDALRGELDEPGHPALPVFQGELNFTTRGVYAANARFKSAYRKAEALLSRAEGLAGVVAAAAPAGGVVIPPVDLKPAWEAVLFNTFHDILPGSSAERCYDEQFDWLAMTSHTARKAEYWTANLLSNLVDTRVRPPAPDMPSGVPLLVFNPHPWPFDGHVELDACLDYRPIWKYRDAPETLPMVVRDPENGDLPVQRISGDDLYSVTLNLRNHVVVPARIPAFGWKLLEFAYDEEARAVEVKDPVQAGNGRIANDTWEVQASPGGAGISITRAGQPVLKAPGLSLVTVEDPWGSWGDFNESPASIDLNEVRFPWTITRVDVGEAGPLRATLRVRLEGGHSQADLTLALAHGRDAVDVSARVFWNERSARLKLVMPGGFTSAEYAVAGGSFTRGALGEVPGGSWVRLEGGNGLGFASDALYNFNLTGEGVLQATIARATRYAADAPAGVEEHPWAAVVDRGELRFRFLLTPGGDTAVLARLAGQLEKPLVVMNVTSSDGPWDKTGSLLSIEPAAIQLLAIKPAESGSGWILRLQSLDSQPVTPTVGWLGQSLHLSEIAPRQISTYLLWKAGGGGWSADPVGLLEE